jgi:hypothetical protein
MHRRRFSDWLRGENSKWLMRYPAMTVMVFLRRDIGYRLLSPVPMIVMTSILMLVAAIIPPDNPDAHPEWLFWFAMISLFLATCQRTKRWREFKKGVLQHTYYIGTSPFDYRWLPQFCRRFRRMARFADPFFCIFAGLVLLPESTALGFWLMIAGAALRIFEDVVFQKELNRDFDILDSVITSEVHSNTVETFDDSAPNTPQSSTNAIPTGLAPDIEAHIRKRR